MTRSREIEAALWSRISDPGLPEQSRSLTYLTLVLLDLAESVASIQAAPAASPVSAEPSVETRESLAYLSQSLAEYQDILTREPTARMPWGALREKGEQLRAAIEDVQRRGL